MPPRLQKRSTAASRLPLTDKDRITSKRILFTPFWQCVTNQIIVLGTLCLERTCRVSFPQRVLNKSKFAISLSRQQKLTRLSGNVISWQCHKFWALNGCLHLFKTRWTNNTRRVLWKHGVLKKEIPKVFVTDYTEGITQTISPVIRSLLVCLAAADLVCWRLVTALDC